MVGQAPQWPHKVYWITNNIPGFDAILVYFNIVERMNVWIRAG